MIKRHIFYIGLNDKNSYRQEVPTIQAYKIIKGVIGDCTITDGKGIYTHANGTQVLETTLIVEVLDFNNNFNYTTVAGTLKTLLNQESIVVIHDSINSELI